MACQGKKTELAHPSQYCQQPFTLADLSEEEQTYTSSVNIFVTKLEYLYNMYIKEDDIAPNISIDCIGNETRA